MQVELRIKQLREKNNISQEELAKKLDLNQSQLCKIENGKRCLKANELIKVCELFNVSIEELKEETNE